MFSAISQDWSTDRDNFGTISRRFGLLFRIATVFGLIISEKKFFLEFVGSEGPNHR